jgi:hypothetical protein
MVGMDKERPDVPVSGIPHSEADDFVFLFDDPALPMELDRRNVVRLGDAAGEPVLSYGRTHPVHRRDIFAIGFPQHC